MYKLGITLIVSVLFLTACNNDDDIEGCMNPDALNFNSEATIDNGGCIFPDEKMTPLLLEYTSRCCPPCGQWGHKLMEETIDNYGSDIVPIAVHTNLNSCTDPMRVAAIESSFRSKIPTSGIPAFFIGNRKTSKDEMNDIMDAAIASNPIAACEFVATRSGNTYKVRTVTQFYDNPKGDKYFGNFYINAYVMENGIDGSEGTGDYQQAGNEESTYYHNNVLRASANPNSAWGTKIVTDEVADDAVIKQELEVELDPSWNYSKLDVAVVIWFKATGSSAYQFVNAADNR